MRQYRQARHSLFFWKKNGALFLDHGIKTLSSTQHARKQGNSAIGAACNCNSNNTKQPRDDTRWWPLWNDRRRGRWGMLHPSMMANGLFWYLFRLVAFLESTNASQMLKTFEHNNETHGHLVGVDFESLNDPAHFPENSHFEEDDGTRLARECPRS